MQMQSLWRHLSLRAQVSSLEQDGMQMPSLHSRGWGQSVEAKQVLGILVQGQHYVKCKSIIDTGSTLRRGSPDALHLGVAGEVLGTDALLPVPGDGALGVEAAAALDGAGVLASAAVTNLIGGAVSVRGAGF